MDTASWMWKQTTYGAGVVTQYVPPKVLLGAAVGVAAVAAVPLVLGAAGFTAAGVAAGSAAAAWQSTIGNVAVGSWFAMLQSAAATGLPSAATAAGGAVGAAVPAAAGIFRRAPAA